MADNLLDRRLNLMRSLINITTKKWLKSVSLILLALTSFIIFWFLDLGVHWEGIFRPTALNFLHLKNPYDNSAFFNPPWALIPIIPFALLPSRLGHALYATVSMGAIGYTAYLMGARKWFLVAFLLMPLTIYNGLDVNVDWMVAIGFLLPPIWGLPLVLLKPQLGIGIAFFWFIQAFKEGGLRKVLTTFAPVTLLFIISFLIYGNYFSRVSFMIGRQEGMWFITIPVAVVLLAAALREKKSGFAIAAGPFLTPYISPGSVPIALIGLMNHPNLAIPAMLGMWILSIDPLIYLISLFK